MSAGPRASIATRKGRPLAQTVIFLERKGELQYRASWSLSSQPALQFELERNVSVESRRSMLALADALATAFKPDWGVAHVDHAIREPWQDDDDRDGELMNRSASLAPVDYYRSGPRGLVMRTYIGPHFIRQLGEDRIASLPLLVEKQSWGGYRVDLVPELHAAQLPALLHAWRAGMAHLAPAGVFAQPQINPGSHASIERRGVSVHRCTSAILWA